jgi:predicted nuclease of predicted toxin-antitoxin system
MKFLVDECTGTSVVACLRDEGHDAVAVVEVMPEADDEEILDRAVAEGRIVVTKGCGIVTLARRTGREQNSDDEGRVGASRRTAAKPLRCSH